MSKAANLIAWARMNEMRLSVAELETIAAEVAAANAIQAQHEQSIRWLADIEEGPAVFIMRDGLEAYVKHARYWRDGQPLKVVETQEVEKDRDVRSYALDLAQSFKPRKRRAYRFEGFRHGGERGAVAVYREIEA